MKLLEAAGEKVPVLEAKDDTEAAVLDPSEIRQPPPRTGSQALSEFTVRPASQVITRLPKYSDAEGK